MLNLSSSFPILSRVTVSMLSSFVFSSFAQHIVLDTFGPGDSYDPSGAPIQNTPPLYRSFAVPFTPDISQNLQELSLATTFSFGPDSMTVNVVGDSGGLPNGTLLESFSGLMSIGLQTFNSSSHPLLDAGTVYWVAVLPGALGTGGGWHLNDQGVFSTLAYDTGSGWSLDTTTLPAVRVVVVPEPLGSVWVAALGLLGFGIWRRARQ